MMKKSYVLLTLIVLILCLLVACDKTPVKDNETDSVTQTEKETKTETESSKPTETESEEPSESESADTETEETEEGEHSWDEGKVSKAPTCSQAGVKTYTCSVCGETKEESLPATGEHTYDMGQVTKTPSCAEVGVKTYTCEACGEKKTEEVAKTEHILGHWTQVKAPTTEEEGLERAECENCDYVEERTLSILEMRYYITVDDGVNKPVQLEFGKDGKYTLEDPIKIGYIFLGWKDDDGNAFSSSGTIDKNVSVKAEWALDGTDSLEELVERAGAGVDKIVITADITVTEPIFFTGATTLTSDGDHTIKRDPNYAGDIFVIGQDKNGTGSVWFGTNVILNVSGETGNITIDGNRDNVKVTVLGSAFFVTDSATVNIYDKVTIANNIKLGNERTYKCDGFSSKLGMSRAGGAAIIIMNGTVNMYGGVIENNAVKTEHTPVKNEDGTETQAEDAGCGGAIYNYGNFNMYGGVIRNNEALRGGAIYNDEIIHLVSGSIESSIAHTYGGAVSSSSSTDAQMFIGTEGASDKKMIFSSNRSLYTGGALYSNTNSPIIIYGNTEFVKNSSESSGGAIYTAGGLTVNGATFKENYTVASSGGAIYYLYGKAEFSRRHMELTNCTFIGNSANLGGAVILSANGECEEMGTYATITGCVFTDNKAVTYENKHGNGGAIYITRKSESIITDCEFVGNTADINGGALSIQSGAKVDLSNIKFTNNSSTLGGALHTSSATVVSIDGATFTENKAILNANGGSGNGGAIFVSNATVTLKNIEISNNQADNHAGALYMNAVTVELDSTVSFKNNSAKAHGGAIYVTYTTDSEGNKNGGVLNVTGVTFENNTALSGGAISARSASTLNLTDVNFIGNTTPEAQVSTSDGGGAIYSNNSTLTLTNVNMDGNLSGYYGGALKLDDCETTLNNVKVINSTGGTGGAIYANSGSLNVDGLVLENNKSALNGVVYLTKLTANINNLTASNNEAVSGGAIFASTNSNVTVTNSSFSGNSAGNGGAIFAANKSTVSVTASTFTKNVASKNGGALYATGASLTTGDNSTFTENTAGNYGGAIFVHEYVEKIDVTPEGSEEKVEEEVVYKTTFSADGVKFDNNTAGSGAAVYVAKNEYTINNAEFVGNKATAENYGGAAIYNSASKSTLSNVTFTGNTSHKGGAVALHSESDMTVTEMVAMGNSATLNSEQSLGVGGVFYVNNSTLSLIAAEGKNITFGGSEEGEANTAQTGGAIQAENNAKLTVKGATFTGNNAQANGGAILIQWGTLELCDVIMTSNTSGNHGGAVSSSGTQVTVSGDSKFVNNTAIKHAGAIYVSYSGELFGNLTVDGGLFEGNTALGGGAVSVRSNCKATFTETVFNKNRAIGYDGENDGDGEGGGAIYVGFGEIELNNVTAKDNTADGHGGAVDSYNGKVSVSGGIFEGNAAPFGGAINHNTKTITVKDATITGNSNGIYIAKGNLEISGNVTVKDNSSENTTSNVYLANGTKICVVGELGENALIGAGGVGVGDSLAVADGKTITTLADYTDRFFCDSGIPVYANEDGEIACGFVIITQPMYVNGYTAVASGNPTYAWFTWVNGEIGEAIYGETSGALKNKTEGVSYVCKITFGDETLITEPVTYRAEKSHPICGESCSCTDTTHENTVWLPITNISELEYAAKNGGNYYLASDTVLEKTLTIRADMALCLNGQKLTGTGEGSFSLLNVLSGVTLTLTDCNSDERAGYIDPVTGLWTEGEYAGEGEAVVYKLYGGVITGGRASLGGAIYSKGDVNLWGVNIAGNSATSNGGAIDMVGGTLTASGDNVFVGNTATGHAGAIYLTYTKNADNTNDGSLCIMNGGIFAYNRAMGGGAISIRTACEGKFVGTAFVNNTSVGYADKNDGDGEGGGAIYVGYGKLTLNNVTATNNTSEYFGAAVDSVSSTVIVNGGVFENNNAQYSGAFYVITKSHVTINETTFRSNASTYKNAEYSGSFGGGAINIKSSTLEMSGVILDSNSTECYGGAILASKSEIVIKNNSVIKNSVGETGAALNLRDSCTVTISDTTFENNISDSNGVIYANSGSLTINKVTATNNKAHQGGIFYLSGGTIEITELNATNNSATYGGVIFVSGVANVTLTDSILAENTAKKGGAVYVRGGEITLGSGTVLKNNSAQQQGGAVYAEGGKLNANGASFEENTAPAAGAVMGVYQSVTEILNTTFKNNSSTGNGGALQIDGATVTVGEGTRFEGNSATGNGGAIAIYEYTLTVESTVEGEEATTTMIKATVLISGVNFTNNTAERGGALYVSQNAYTVKNSVFDKNTATHTNYGGGAIYTTGGEGTLSGITFTGNTSHKGGAVALHSKSSMTVTSLVATSNSATLNSDNGLGLGGVFYVNNSSLELVAGEGESIVFGGEESASANTAATTGGAIQAENNSTVKVSGASFIGNTAKGNGGAICTHSGSLTLADVKMSGNSSANHGGAVSATGTAVTISGDSEFVKNTATNHGGAIYLSYTSSANGTIDMTGGSFDSNTALAGGAVSVRSNCTATFNGTSFTKNAVTGYAGENDGDGDGGGAIYVGYGKLNLINVTMSENTAQYFGAAIASAGSTVTINGGIFEKNSGGYSGAIHAITSSKVTVNGTTFKGNSTDATSNAERGGGAIAVKGSSTLDLVGVIMDGNTSGYYGGAIFASKSTVTVKDNCEIKNSTGATGAAVYSRDESTVTIIDSKLSNNTSTGSGVFYANSGKFTVKNTEVTENKGDKGVFYFSGGTIEITGITAKGNSATTGGVIYANNAAVKNFTVSDSTFTGNSATSGGAIAIASKSIATLKNLVFSSNTASSGSDVYVAGGANVTLEGAATSSAAGAIYATGSGTTVNVKYATEEEKSAWEAVIETVSSATVSYVAS